jgi:acyl-CoA thioesterase FadM
MLIHTPRTLFAIGKGLVRRRKDGVSAGVGGIGDDNPYISHHRAGIFDCDYLLHMNNAAYLSHAEYARWELCAYNGLMDSMFKDKVREAVTINCYTGANIRLTALVFVFSFTDQVNFMVGGCAIRYRKEIKPPGRRLDVHSVVARLDERHLWIYHTFRYPPGGQDPGRIRAHMVCQGLALQGRNVLDPRKYLTEKVGMDAGLIESLSQESSNTTMADLMDKYMDMEVKFKEAASQDDDKITNKTEKKS